MTRMKLFVFAVILCSSVISAQNLTDSLEDESVIDRLTDSTDDNDVAESTTSKCETTAVDERVMGMNIGLFYILEELKKNPSTELLIKVLVMTSKIEKQRGSIISLNKERLKIISDLVPVAYKEAICS
ncbi:uncharacterized protein [Parasteatoda tepidariorum]|uniref:uncharacterized protein n=1 Tax=Parasteatoda tepidariorum TaxID=114398 RepID=UPI001C71CEC9|nr:uncharacterized protein LOC107441070 [Parasteatoda tepidariorum]